MVVVKPDGYIRHTAQSIELAKVHLRHPLLVSISPRREGVGAVQRRTERGTHRVA